ASASLRQSRAHLGHLPGAVGLNRGPSHGGTTAGESTKAGAPKARGRSPGKGHEGWLLDRLFVSLRVLRGSPLPGPVSGGGRLRLVGVLEEQLAGGRGVDDDVVAFVELA